MPFVYEPRKTRRNFGGVSTGSRPQPGVRSSGGGGSRYGFGGGSLQAPAQLATSRERGAPERLEADVMGAVQTAAMAPAHALERPLAVANTAARFVMGTPEDAPGPIDGILKGIGDIGFGQGANVGAVVGAIGKGIMDVGNAPMALINAGDADLLAQVADLPDDTPLNAQTVGRPVNKRVDGLPILGMLGLGGRDMTVGEFKAELARRGFNQQFNEETGEVTELPWEQVVQKARDDVFGFGDKAINDSVFVDLAGRVALDPFNVLLGAGVIGKAGRLANWATRSRLGTLSAAAGSQLRSAYGVGYLADMASAGVRLAQKPSAIVSARAITAGRMEGATLRGLGHVLAAPRTLLLPGTGSLPRRYARGALRLELGLLGAEGATGFADGVATSVLGEDNIVSGFMEPVHDAAQAFLADKPMSQDITFMMVSAFAMPAVPLLKEDIGAVRGAARDTFGDQDLYLWGREFGVDNSGVRGRQDPLGRRRGKAKESELVARLGGKLEFARLIDHVDMRIAFDRLKAYSPIIRHFESFDEAMARSRAIGHVVAAEARRLRETGQIKAQNRLDAFKGWGRAHSRTVVDRKGNLIKDVPQRVDFELSSEEFIAQWMRYRDVHAQLASRFQPVGEAILGRANRLTKEDLQFVKATIAAASKGGRVSTAYVRDILSQTPAMFEDSSLSPAQHEFWTRLMNLGVSATENGQGTGRRFAGRDATIDASELDAQLNALLKTAPEARELYHEAAASERKAPASPSKAGGGIVRGGKLRRIYSQKKLRDLRVNANGEVRSLQKELDALSMAFERKWTKRGNLRAQFARTIVPSKPDKAPNTPVHDLQRIARIYNETHGIGPLRQGEYWALDTDFARRTGEAYEAMPRVARERDDFDTMGVEEYGFISASRQPNATPKLDRSFETVPPTRSSMSLFRIVSKSRAEALRAQAGETISWPGYMSTAVSREQALPYQPPGSPVIRVEVPEGVRVLDMDTIGNWPNPMPVLQKARENGFTTGEQLLEKDLQFKVRLDGDEIVLTAVRPERTYTWPTGEETRIAYEAFAAETLEQYKALTEAGYIMEPWTQDGQPYANSMEMQADVANNKHLYFFTGGEPHPFLGTPLPQYGGLTANDIFRAVHDIITHATEGYQFGARGEVNAAIKHSQMFSPVARRAMLSETHGQNSWVNYGPHDPQQLAAPDRPYAVQKAALLPEEIIAEFENRYLGVPVPDHLRAVADQRRAAEKEALAVEREAELLEMSIKRDRIRELRSEVREINKRAAEIITTRIDPSFLDENGNPTVEPASLEALREQTAFVQDNFPRNYGVEKAPKASYARYEPDDSHLAALLTERSNLAQILFDYGPIAKMTQFIEHATSPVKASAMAHDGRQQVFNLLLPLKAKTEEVSKFLEGLREAQNEGYSIGKLHQPFFRGVTSLPPNRMQVIARDAFGANSGFIEAFTAKYGGLDRIHVMLDEAHNSLVRRIDQRVMRGQKNGRLERIFRSGYWAWQHLPGLRTASDATRMGSKVFYPLFRFSMDIRWQALNIIEADTMAFFRDGIDGTRFSRTQDQIVRRGGRDVNLTQNAVDFHGEQSGMPQAGKKGKLAEAAYEDTGVFLTNQNLAPVLKRSFQKQSLENVDAVLNDLAETDPVLQLLQRKYGTEKGTWAEQVNETLYSFDRRGVRQTIDEAVRKVRKYEKWSQAEYDQMVPLINKLVERNQQTFDDLTQIHIGNINRSRLERTLNSFWLYWPISYQIKATKWMAGLLTQRSFGQQTNLGGAFTLDRAAQRFREMVSSNAEFQQQMEDNEDWWFAASMLLPIAPWDYGMSLNRHVRYVGGNVLGLWPEYAGLENPGDYAAKAFEMGPIYTVELAQRLFAGHTDAGPSGPTPTSIAP